jgi:SpoVK/Ycf46/Vps4 family AAA+-type ATPase
MNADLLKRVIRAIADGSQDDLNRLAHKIVELERKTGHKILAQNLEAILRHPGDRENGHGPALSEERTLKHLPLSRRYDESLATFTMPEVLEHHMILPMDTEDRFARIESEYAARDRLGAHGLKPRKTILLYGPPGCGKSLGAKRLAWSTGLPLMKVQFDVLLSSYFGESASNLRSVFIAARELPCVLLLDECDFIARSRINTKDIGEAARIVNSLLQFMEEYDAPGLLVATTNIESSLDFAMFRRFDDVFQVPLPGPQEIEKLLHSTLSGVRVAATISWSEFVSDLSGESAAMIVKVARDAAKAAVLAGHESVTETHLRQAVFDDLRRGDRSPRGQ